MSASLGDLRMWWTQSPRDLDDVDKLVQLKNYYAIQLGNEKVSEIEADVSLYADADQFRIFHKTGRFNGTICAAATTMGAFTFMGQNQPGGGFRLMKSQPLLAGGVFGGSLFVWYNLWSMKSGYTKAKYCEF